MIFEYDELKEFITEDFDRFYQMGFSETQIYPAILNEYKYGEDFCPAENICIHIFLALNYVKNGLNFKIITEKLNHLITEEREQEIRAALGNEFIKYIADLALLMKNISWEHKG